jgi:hypothetical protein
VDSLLQGERQRGLSAYRNSVTEFLPQIVEHGPRVQDIAKVVRIWRSRRTLPDTAIAVCEVALASKSEADGAESGGDDIGKDGGSSGDDDDDDDVGKRKRKTSLPELPPSPNSTAAVAIGAIAD